MSFIIGIIGRPNKLERKIISFSQSVIDVINHFEAIPLGIIPSNKDIAQSLSDSDKLKLYRMIDLCDGIILQGGKDEYAYDIEAIKYINQNNIPVLGICLGMQTLALATGGKLTSVDDHRVDKDYVHKVKIESDSKLAKIILDNDILVNSRHLEAVINPGIYNIVAKDDNGIIEAIEDPHKNFNIGIQWHPEDLFLTDKHAKDLFAAFFNSCAYYQIIKTMNEKK